MCSIQLHRHLDLRRKEKGNCTFFLSWYLLLACVLSLHRIGILTVLPALICPRGASEKEPAKPEPTGAKPNRIEPLASARLL